MSHWAHAHAHTGASIFGPGDLRSRSTRRRPAEDGESAQTSTERVCARVCVCARAGFHYLYKENNEEIEVGYSPELLEEILWDEIPYSVLWEREKNNQDEDTDGGKCRSSVVHFDQLLQRAQIHQ